MKEKTLSFLILFFFILGIFSYFLMGENFGLELKQRHIAGYVFAVAFGATPFFIMLKIVSRIFLPSSFGNVRLSTLEGTFMLYYFFLTKEAREEWRAYIEKKKIEAN
ncbi:MAG: hypothetical protein LBE81_07715 [Azonexus sp.]|jgi:hypothetical protein|uniref:hypothetical protein n=1 Tax=Azonexus sp. TaxID=1872668 RepID=UPI002821E576|nr:hypothetical protein [Azonexus sp.]MDR0776508.1 hypothetical protein [Azonexus sp.]